MAARAFTFSIRGDDPARFAAGALEHLRSASGPGAGIVALSGPLAERIGDVARALEAGAPGCPLLIGTGVGVLTERGEIEKVPAGVGLWFPGGRPETLVTDAASADDAIDRLATRLGELSRGRAATAMVFAQAEGFGLESVEPLAAVPSLTVLGAGTPGDEGIFALDREGRLAEGRVGALLASGLTPARVRVSPACRLLMPLCTITEARGPLVIEVAGERALDVLERVGSELTGQPLVLAVLAPPVEPGVEGRPELLVRGIQGVDPARRAIVLSGDIATGTRFAFAVRDAPAARSDLERVTRELSRELQGSAPLFGIYASCASRGTALYATPDVDVRVIRTSFPDVPVVGLHSAFEIAPHDGAATVHYYTGVLGLFSTPS